MTADWTHWIVFTAGTYLLAGLAFGVVCLVMGLARLDSAARDMPLAARVLVLPGLVALWPLMLVKWVRRSQPPVS